MSEIRKMKRGDLDQVLLIEEASFSSSWSRKMFEEELDAENSKYYVLNDTNNKNRVIGYCGIKMILDEGHVMTIAVKENERGKGKGAELARKLIDIATKFSIATLFLEVRQTNYTAINLYEKMKFEKITLRSKYYQDNNEDAIIMALKLR